MQPLFRTSTPGLKKVPNHESQRPLPPAGNEAGQFGAVFTPHELGFVYVGGGEPTFMNYLIGLNKAGLGTRNRSSLMKTLGEFLFNDGTALSKIGS